MYLSDWELEDAVKAGKLIVDPAPATYDTTSIDLHLDSIEEAKVWDIGAFARQQKEAGLEPRLRVGQFEAKLFSTRFNQKVPEDSSQDVYRDGGSIILKPRGFFLWQTKEQVGTPEHNPRLICFVDGKSTRARTGLLVHMTAPTIHAGWWGHVTLEIANLGPFTLQLNAGDAIAQIVVARLSSAPRHRKQAKGVAVGQATVAGTAGTSAKDARERAPGAKRPAARKADTRPRR
jgi:dCTP deaminase